MIAGEFAFSPIVADSPSFTIRHDRAAGVVRVVGQGFWSTAFVDEHFSKLEAIVQSIHAESGHALVIVDLSGAPVQSPEVAERIRIHTNRIYEPGDRVALVLQSSLMKAQMRRVAWDHDLDVFLSPNAAETWVTAHR